MKFINVLTDDGYITEVRCSKSHANPFHNAGIIVTDHNKEIFFVSSDEGVYLSKKDLKEIINKMR